MSEPIKWSAAPDRTSWGASMRVADIEIDRDHTLTLYCEADQTAKVDAMFAERQVQAAVTAEREACAKVCEPQDGHDDPLTAWKIAAAIRARGEK